MATRALTDIQGKDGALKILLIGDAREDLPGVRDEFRAIIDSFSPLKEQRYLHANFLVGQDLTMQKFELRVSNTRYTIIHYAGHTMGNGLVLPFADSDVDTREFIRIVNQNPPTLLVMDACNSLGDPEELDLATPLLIDSGAVFAVGTRCLVPECGGISQTDPSIREALWDRYSTAAPRPRTRSELQYSDRRLRSKSWPPSTV